MNFRKITSMVLLCSLVLTLITSVVLYIMPHGRVAYWSDWRLWGLDKHQWSALHINLGLLFIISGVVHIVYNWKAILNYFKKRAGGSISAEAMSAILIAVIFTAGTLLEVPPFSSVMTLEEHIKDLGADKYGEPPYGHAELSSLEMLCARTNIDLEGAVSRLKDKGIRFHGVKETVLNIAHENGLTPAQLFEIIRKAPDKSGQPNARSQGQALHKFPEFPSPGFGRKRLEEVCDSSGIDCEKLIELLAKSGIEAEAGQRIKEIAGQNQMEPMALFEKLKQAACRL